MADQFNAGPPIGPVASKDELLAALDSLPWDDERKASVLDRYAAWESKASKPAQPEKPKSDSVLAPFFERIMGKDKDRPPVTQSKK